MSIQSIQTILDDTIAELRRMPQVVLEAAVVLPGWTAVSLKDFEDHVGLSFPVWVAQLYMEVGGAHIAWRLSSAGYEQLDPGRADNKHRYDISGNLDLLTPQEVINAFTGHNWDQIYRGGTNNYRPLDFSHYAMNMGFVSRPGPQEEGPILQVLYDDRRVALGVTVAEYLRSGLELLFMHNWQSTFLRDEDWVLDSRELRDLRSRLPALSAG